MGQLDLLLVNPGGRTEVYQSLASELSAIEPPVWAGLMATYARGQGLNVDVLDVNALGLSNTQAAAIVSDLDPILTVIVVYGHQPSASTQNMPGAGDLCSEITKLDPSQKKLLVGGHVAALPERTLREEDVEYVASGEGVITIVDLVLGIKAGGNRLDKIPGLWYWDDGQVVSNPAAPILMDLGQYMDGVAWDLLPMDRYRAHNWHCFGDLERKPYAAIYTTLGCPYRCSFCCIQAPFKSGEKVLEMSPNVNSYRFWPVNSIINQIDLLVNQYGVKNLKISDEMFVLNKRHVHSVCDYIIDRGYNLNIWAYARADTIGDPVTIEKLKKAGFNWLCLGIESGTDRVLSDVAKTYSRAELYKNVDGVRSQDISIIANFIFGLPEDNMDSMESTFNLATELNCEFANFYCAMAYPGSRLYETALENGWPLPNTWSEYSQHSVDTFPLHTNYLSGRDILRFRDSAFNRYFTSDMYLRMIGRKFGNDTVEHIKEMTSYDLVRKNS